MNEKFSKFVVIAVLALILVSGWWVTSGEEADVTPQGEVDLHPTDPVQTDPSFEFEGQVLYDPPSENPSVSDVTLCLYDGDGSVIESRSLETLGTDSRVRNVTLKAESPPDYIVVHHPMFYETEGFQANMLEFVPRSGLYRKVTVAGLPFDVSRLERGSCEVPE